MDLETYAAAPWWRRLIDDIRRARARTRDLSPYATPLARWRASRISPRCLRCGGDCWHSGWCYWCGERGNADTCICTPGHEDVRDA